MVNPGIEQATHAIAMTAARNTIGALEADLYYARAAVRWMAAIVILETAAIVGLGIALVAR